MFNLSNYPTKAPKGLDRLQTNKETHALQTRLFDLQRLLYANGEHSLLIVLQGLDAAGKDGTIRHVFSCVNPMGRNVTSFKKPGLDERKHDFLWRIYPHVPAKGMIQIFNRSHYEDILVTIKKRQATEALTSTCMKIFLSVAARKSLGKSFRPIRSGTGII